MKEPSEPLSSNSYKSNDLTWEIISHRLWFKIISAFIICFTLWNFWQRGIWEPLHNMNVDFDIYCRWAKHIQAGYPYLLNGKSPDHPCFYYPPFWGLLIAPFTWIPYNIAQILWYGLNLFWSILFGILIWTWMKKQTHYLENWYRYGILILFLNFTPLFESLRHGQANMLILLLLSAVLWLYYKKKLILAGICLGIATLIKILPIVLIAYWFWKKQWRLVIASLLTILILGLGTGLITGFSTYQKFFADNQIYFQFVKEHWNHQSNVSIYAFLRDGQAQGVFPNSLPMYRISQMIAIALMVFLIWRIPMKTYSFLQTRLEYSLILTSMFLAVNYAEHQQYLLLFLPFALCWAYQEKLKNSIAKGLVLFSWLLIIIGFYFNDLSVAVGEGFLTRYMHTYGVILLWISLVFLLGFQREQKTKN